MSAPSAPGAAPGSRPARRRHRNRSPYAPRPQVFSLWQLAVGILVAAVGVGLCMLVL